MICETIAIKDGDVFRWRYRQAPEAPVPSLTYWAKSCIAVAKNGTLRDTYWSSGSSDGSCWSYGEAAEKLELTFLANLDDLEKRHESDEDYYDDADIVNLNHSNSTKGNFYIRRGAKRSPEKMLQVVRYRRERAEADARYATERVSRFDETIQAIEAGSDLNSIYL